MKKADMSKLLEKIEEYYERNEQLFLGSSEEGEEEESHREGEGSQTKERELELLISSLGSSRRSVHMPGYPE